MELIQYHDCPNFPCAFEDQSCWFCTCPMYPCKIPETGGKWITLKSGNNIWDCSLCLCIHKQEVVELLDLDKNETDDEKLKIAKIKLIIYLNEL